MAGYYGYRRGRYYRRGYRRGYRRYGGTSLRRYRSVQMNDNETKVMTFSSVLDRSIGLASGVGQDVLSPSYLLAGEVTIGPSAGRAFFAGMMFDRVRFRSFSVTIRPKVMPSSSASNYIVYAAWDRYGQVSTGGVEANTYSIRSDPSAKQVVWTPGGSGTPLRTWIYSTSRDRYQYHPIRHSVDSGSWSPFVEDNSFPFYPTLLLAVEAVTADSTSVQFTVFVRATVEFQGGYSNTTLNYTPSGSTLTAAKNVMSPEEIPNAQSDETAQYLAQQFQRMQTSLPTISRR